MKVNIPIEYLASNEIHNGFVLQYEDEIYENRYIVLDKLLSENNKVIDLGCVGYIPNIKDSINNGIYLHDILTKKCSDVLGVDIDLDGVKYVHSLGFSNVICADIIDDSINIKKHFDECGGVDFMILGEILHEVDDSISFLKGIKREYNGFAKKIILTVPNIYRFTNIINALKGKDVNHTENRCWFSPYTICKTFAQAGIQPDELFLAGKTYGKRVFFLKFFKHNICAEHIVAIGIL